ncbi:MAG: MFS transporter [Caulobacteraceae bacterium]
MNGAPASIGASFARRSPRPGLGLKLTYGFGSIAFGVKDQGFASFLLFFYNQVIGAPSAMVGRAIAVALFVDAFADPIVGQVSDNLRSRWGRRHPFMYASALPVAIGYYLLWNPPRLTGGNLFLYLVAIIIVVRTFITVYEIPSSALVAELTTDYDQRTSFLGYRYFFGWVGGLGMTLLAFGVFFHATPRYPQGQLNPAGYVTYSLTASLVMVAAILISSLGTHRHIRGFMVPPKRTFSLGGVFREMFETVKNRNFLVLMVSALFSSIAAGALTALNTYFNTFFWGLTAGQILLLSIFIIAAPVGALFLAPLVSSRMGKKRAAIFLWIGATAFYWFPMAARLLGAFPANGEPLLIPLLAALQTLGTLLSIASQITVSSMLADVVEDSQRRTGRRSEGLFFAANAFTMKAVSGMGILAATILLTIVHFPAHADPAHLDPQIPRNLAIAYFPLTFTFYAIALGALSFYRIDRAAHEENVRTLAAEAALAPVAVGLGGPLTSEHGSPSSEADV